MSNCWTIVISSDLIFKYLRNYCSYNKSYKDHKDKNQLQKKDSSVFFLFIFQPNAKVMDPICTFLFSIIVICSTLKLVKDSVYIVMEAFPLNYDYNAILMSLQGLNGIRHVHSLCVWSLTLDTNVLTVHLAVGKLW